MNMVFTPLRSIASVMSRMLGLACCRSTKLAAVQQRTVDLVGRRIERDVRQLWHSRFQCQAARKFWLRTKRTMLR
jgi:hypothetical protein